MQNQEYQPNQPTTPQPVIASPPVQDDAPAKKTVVVARIIRIISTLIFLGSIATFVLYRYANFFNIDRMNLLIPVITSIVGIFTGAIAIVSTVAANSKILFLIYSVILMVTPIILLFII